MEASDVDLSFLPDRVRNTAHLVTGGKEVMWHRTDVREAIDALAAAGVVVLGLDVRRYFADGTFMEALWGPSAGRDLASPAAARSAALEELEFMTAAGLAEYDWVLVTW